MAYARPDLSILDSQVPNYVYTKGKLHYRLIAVQPV
jgi:hypothetical protein